jgi:hypothetical protein
VSPRRILGYWILRQRARCVLCGSAQVRCDVGTRGGVDGWRGGVNGCRGDRGWI